MCVCVGVYVCLKGVHLGAWCSEEEWLVSLSPRGGGLEGGKQGVQTQGTHQALEAGTQRAQKHTAQHPHTRTLCQSEGFGCLCVSRSVRYTSSGTTCDMFTGDLVTMCWILPEQTSKGGS